MASRGAGTIHPAMSASRNAEMAVISQSRLRVRLVLTMLHAESCRLIGPAGECRWRGYDLRRRSREACFRFRRERMQKCRAGRSAIRPAPLAQVVRDVRGAV